MGRGACFSCHSSEVGVDRARVNEGNFDSVIISNVNSVGTDLVCHRSIHEDV